LANSADDPKRAADFYRKVFDWKVAKWAGPSDSWLIRTGDEKEPGITGGVAARMEPGDTTVMMVDIPNVDQFAERVKRAGGTIGKPKRVIPGAGDLVTCRDADGNSFGIMQIDRNAK
jgi:predicted enzyme related to lactoylglutathione lyase